MTTTLRPHDLIWLTARDALEGITDDWVEAAWHTGLPVVVRRDVDNAGRVPVGVRGLRRDQRAAGWVKPEHVTRVVLPESLSVTADLLRSPLCDAATGTGGATTFSAAVAMVVGHYRQHWLCAGDQYSGYPCRQRSRPVDPRPAADFP